MSGEERMQKARDYRGQILTCESLSDFLVDNDIDFNASLSCCLKHPIKTILLVPGGRSPKVQLRREPP